MKLLWVKKIFFIAAIIALASCTPEEIEFPKEAETQSFFAPSNAITSLFNEINAGKIDLEELCFEFEYPISFQAESEVIIEIENEAGLQDLINSQTSGFFINKVNFPLTVIAGEPTEIFTDQDFQELLLQCGIESLSSLLSIFDEECSKFEYPISLRIDDSDVQEVNSYEQLLSLFEDQSAFFLLNFSYPIQLSTGETIRNDFELYQSLDDCQACPEIYFVEVDNPDDLILDAFLERSEDVGTFKWYIDNEFIEEDGHKVDGDFLLNVTEAINTPGSYEVCVFAAYEYCDAALSFCEEVTIEERCPDNFAFDVVGISEEVRDDSLQYLFEVEDFNYLEDSEIKWYIGDELVQVGPTAENLRLQKNFTSGQFTICVEYISNFCLQQVRICETIEVIIEEESSCPEMFFGFQNIGGNSYIFFADFLGIETLEWYGWFVDGSLMEEEGTLSGGDNQFEFTFNEPGIHSVCILTETPDCPTGAEYCVQIEVGD